MSAGPLMEEFIERVGTLSAEDQQTVLSIVTWALRQPHRVSFRLESKTYGTLEGLFHFGPLLAQVCARLQRGAAPENDAGKRVNDGPTTIATGDGSGGITKWVLDGPLDGGTLIAMEICAANILGDFTKYEHFFENALERLTALVEDAVMKQFEGKNYTRLKEVKVGDTITAELVEQTVVYAESQRERRDKIWKPPLKDETRLARGRPQERLDFERKLRTAVRKVRKRGLRVTQGRVAEVFDPKKPKYSARSLQKRLHTYGLPWAEVRLW